MRSKTLNEPAIVTVHEIRVNSIEQTASHKPYQCYYYSRFQGVCQDFLKGEGGSSELQPTFRIISRLIII